MLKFALLSIFFLFACTTPQNSANKTMTTNIKELSERSGIAFSEKSRVIFQEDNLGAKQEAQNWLIYSDSPLTLPKGELGYKEKDDAKEYLSNFQKNAREENFGTLKSTKSLSSSWLKDDGVWRKEPGRWDGTIIETEKGFYLNLEWVKQ
jgi:hypothetical protein